MTLFLVETTLNGATTKQQVEAITAQVAEAHKILEVQVAGDFTKAYYILDNEVAPTLEVAGLTVDLVKEVRLVGKPVEEVNEAVNYLVEWEIPSNITMEQYLTRKKNNAVRYEEVPEVHFSRTYVCEDMTKCLCFYDAPDEAAVKRAREAVQTPITSLTKLAD